MFHLGHSLKHARTRVLRTYSTSGTMGRLDGKVAIVTASTDGIGLAIARRLGKEGAMVMVSSRKQKNVDYAVRELKKDNITAHGVVCHVARNEDRHNLVMETIKTFGDIDILVSNAGSNPHFGPLVDITEEMWDKTFETNLKAALLLTKEVVPSMQKRGGGSVVFVSSIGAYTPIPMLGAYSVTKTALIGLSKALAVELGSQNIRVNVIAPGVIQTKFSKMLTETESIANKALENTPLGRFGTADDCAGAVAFLASQDSSYITGETILITGGMPARL